MSTRKRFAGLAVSRGVCSVYVGNKRDAARIEVLSGGLLPACAFFFGGLGMKNLISLATALVVGIAAIGCEHKATMEKKTQTTTTTPGGETKTTVDQKVETTPNSETRTTTEKTETKPANP